MALWAGTALNTNELAMVFNQVYNRKFIDQVHRKHGLLEALMGLSDVNATPNMPAFERLKKITGRKIEVKLLGKYKDIGTLADGSAEVATTVGSHVADKFGAAEFDLTHYNDQEYIPRSELDRFAGDESKTLNYVEDIFDYVIASWHTTLAKAVSGAGDQSRTTMGSWEFAINNNTYGTIDRTDSGNSDFRGHEKSSFSTFSLDALQTELTTVWLAGEPDYMGAPAAIFTVILKAMRDEGQLHYFYKDDGHLGAGGVSFSWAGMKIVLDKHMTSGTIALLDSSTWVFYMQDKDFVRDIMPDTSKKSAWVINSDAWTALICKQPNANGHMSGVS